MKLRHVLTCEKGKVRSRNEDAAAWYDIPTQDGKSVALAVVSDGMGGHANGHLASALTVEQLYQGVLQHFDQSAFTLQDVGLEVNNRVFRSSIQHRQRMGATCTALLLVEDEMKIIHVGDSRCYLAGREKFAQLTRDHTLAEELSSLRGFLTPGDFAGVNPHVLTLAIGMRSESEFQGDIFTVDRQIAVGDRMLICSDGLYLHVKDEELERSLRSDDPIEQIADQWTQMTLDRGARDNFSFIIIECIT